MDTLVLDIVINWKWLGTIKQTSILILMQLSCAVLWMKLQLAMSAIKDTQ